MNASLGTSTRIPWFGARKMVRALISQLDAVRKERDLMREHLEKLGALDVIALEQRKRQLESELKEQIERIEREQSAGEQERAKLLQRLATIRKEIVVTEELAVLQEVGVYKYRHPLADAVQYQRRLEQIEAVIKEMAKKDGGAIRSARNWTVDNSLTKGRAMVRDISKLMLRAYNAEADYLVRSLKPHKLDSAIDRLNKVERTIEKLGKVMEIEIEDAYHRLRIEELALTADFLEKQAEEKEAERLERERIREEKKVQQEIERERQKLEKERRHYENALQALIEKGDTEGAARMQDEMQDVVRKIEDVDYRAANIRAGYVYVISNIGSFGESIVKVGMTRRLDPTDRIRELSDASVPFNFDTHALFFSRDAVGIESAMHERLADARVNIVNRRREFFRATPSEVKAHLAELAGDLLEYQEVPEALEYRQCLAGARP